MLASVVYASVTKLFYKINETQNHGKNTPRIQTSWRNSNDVTTNECATYQVGGG